VIVLDANILLYAYSTGSPRHKEARAWLEKVLSGAEPVGLPWPSLTAFIRIATNPRLPGFRRSIEEVSRTVDEWLEQPSVSADTGR